MLLDEGRSVLVSTAIVVCLVTGYTLYKRSDGPARRVAPLHRTGGLSGTLGTIVVIPVNRIFTPRYRLRESVLNGLITLLNLLAVAGLALSVANGRPRFFGMTFITLFAVVLLDAMIFIPDKRSPEIWSADHSVWTVARDRRVAVSALLSAVATLFLVGPGLAYFLFIAVFFSSMILHVLLGDQLDAVSSVDLVLLALGAAFLLASQTFTVAYFMRAGDTVAHTAYARQIASAESITAIEATRYDDLTLFHTLAAVNIQLSSLAPRRLIGVLFVVLFPTTLVAAFCVIRNITKSAKIGLLGAALLAVNPEFINWGTRAHVQSLSFVFFSILLLLLTKWKRDIRYTALTAVIALAWTMTHHLSVFMGVVLIAGWVVVGALWSVSLDHASLERIEQPLQRYAVLTLIVGAYWWMTGLYRIPLWWITKFSPSADQGIPTGGFLIQNYSDPVALAQAAVPFLLINSHHAFMLALIGYSLWTVVRPGGKAPSDTFPKVALGAVFAVALYYPNPLWIPLRGVAVLNRWGIMTTLFVISLAALGIRRLPVVLDRSTNVATVAVLVLVTTFMLVGGGFTDPSLAQATGHEKKAQKHFTTGELAVSDHVLRHSDDASVHSSKSLKEYLPYERWVRDGPTPLPDKERFGVTNVRDGQIVVDPGLTILRQEAIRENGVKLAVVPAESRFYDAEITILTPLTSESAQVTVESENVVYQNSETSVVYEPEETETTDEE
jgi:hypothetical protein